MYVIGKGFGKEFQRLSEAPEFFDDQAYEARQWATLHMARNNIPVAGHPDSLTVHHVMQMPKGVN